MVIYTARVEDYDLMDERKRICIERKTEKVWYAFTLIQEWAGGLALFGMIIISGKINKGMLRLVLCKYLQFLPCLIVGDGMICHPHNYLYRRLCQYTIKFI